jgi:hypothetical protein
MLLKPVFDKKLEVDALKAKIQKIEEDNGLPALTKELKALQTTLEALLAEAVLKGVMEDGPLRIVSAGRNTKKIRYGEFTERYPDLAAEFATIPITGVTEALIQKCIDEGMTKKDAKRIVEEELEDIIDIKPSEKWDIIDLVGGSQGSG